MLRLNLKKMVGRFRNQMKKNAFSPTLFGP